jgi:hypothetical protein
MVSTGLDGPYVLTSSKIDEVVTRISPGTYVLDRKNESGTFIVCYVGRSDDNINQRLKDWVNSRYLRFKFGYFGSPKAAFEKECKIYHDFGESEKLDNQVHPARLEDSDWKCPVCDIFD